MEILKHPFISLYSKYQSLKHICLPVVNSPIFPSLDDIYCKNMINKIYSLFSIALINSVSDDSPLSYVPQFYHEKVFFQNWQLRKDEVVSSDSQSPISSMWRITRQLSMIMALHLVKKKLVPLFSELKLDMSQRRKMLRGRSRKFCSVINKIIAIQNFKT